MTRRLPNSFSEKAIKAVWSDNRDRNPSTAGRPGIDGVTAEAFGSHLPSNIARIRRLIQQDAYQFSRLRVAPIHKKTGDGYRIIAVPTVQDRLVQRVILKHLEDDKHFAGSSPIAYGFRKGRTLIDAQKRALELRAERPWVAQSDIVKFFDNIERKIIGAKIRSSVRSKVIRELLEKAVNCELDHSNPKANSIAMANGIVKGLGLRQGMPVSPLLSNLLLKDFDTALVKNGTFAVRYADDIAIFGRTEEECLGALEFVRSALQKLKLFIPELGSGSKTIVTPPTEKVEFLGIDIKHYNEGYRLCAPSGRLEKIDAELSEISCVEYCEEHKITLGKALTHMEAFLIGHNRSLTSVSDHDQFVARLAVIQKKHTQRLIISIIGKSAAANLTDAKRAVLGLQDFRA